jgi:hypothetical protein
MSSASRATMLLSARAEKRCRSLASFAPRAGQHQGGPSAVPKGHRRMPLADRSLARLRAPAVVAPLLLLLAPLLLALGGCVAVPMMELAAMPTSRPTVACGPGNPDCPAGGTDPGGMVSGGLGLAVSLARLVPPMRPGPCAHGPLGGPGPGCEGAPPPGVVHANGMPKLPAGIPAAEAPAGVPAAAPANCSVTAQGSGNPGCNGAGGGSMIEGLAGSLQKFSPAGLFR